MVLNSLKTDFKEIKNKVKEVIPICDKGISRKAWDRIKERYIRRYSNLCDGSLNISSSAFIDIVVLAHTGDYNANAVICHVKDCVETVSSYVKTHPQFKSAYYNILRNIVMSFDETPNSNNSDFKNYISELSILSVLCKSSCFELQEIEKALDNGMSVDFYCKAIGSQKDIIFDVITYQNIDPSLHKTSETMNTFLDKRISDKYSTKMKKLHQGAFYEFRVLPIVEYKEGMENFCYKVDDSKSLPIMAYFANTIDDHTEFCLMDLNELCKVIRTSRNIQAV